MFTRVCVFAAVFVVAAASSCYDGQYDSPISGNCLASSGSINALPPAKTISESCDCVRTVVRPQVSQQVYNVPGIRKEVQTIVKPVVESYTYNTCPTFSASLNAPGIDSSLVNNAPSAPLEYLNYPNEAALPQIISSPCSGSVNYANAGSSDYLNYANAGSSDYLNYANAAPIVQDRFSTIGAPRVISESCDCVKTVVRPEVSQNVVQVPAVSQQVQTVVRPVVEKYSYNTQPSCSNGNTCAYGANYDSAPLAVDAFASSPCGY